MNTKSSEHAKINSIIQSTLWLMLGLFPLSLMAKPPLGKPFPRTIVEYRVVGVTTTTTNGDIRVFNNFGEELRGFAAMNEYCRQEIAPNSRVATSNEWTLPRRFQLPQGFNGVWLDPGVLTPIYIPDSISNSDWIVIDDSSRSSSNSTGASPTEALKNSNCNNYNDTAGNNGLNGTIGLPTGIIITPTCSNVAHIACSAPVKIRVTQ